MGNEVFDTGEVINDKNLKKPCLDGFAGNYPCLGYDLLTQISLREFGSNSANDNWGWKDPETEKEYVQAAKLIGLPKFTIILRHILPNTLRPVLVIATIGLALAIIAEATLSFLGQGIPPTTPSLGTLIRVGNEFLFSGLWWITLFPAIALIILVFSVNLLGDWMRDALNPKLR